MESRLSEDFIKSCGPQFFAHLLRRVSDQIVRGEEIWLSETGGVTPPRTVSTLYALDRFGPLGVTQIASLLRQSHPMAITWARQLTSRGLVEARVDSGDRRRTVLSLTRKGKKELARVKREGQIIIAAQAELFAQARADIYDALWRIEEALREKPFAERLRETAQKGGGGPSTQDPGSVD